MGQQQHLRFLLLRQAQIYNNLFVWQKSLFEFFRLTSKQKSDSILIY